MNKDEYDKISRLLKFLPVAESAIDTEENFKLVSGSTENGARVMPHIQYSENIHALISMLIRDGWADEPTYCPHETGELINDSDAIENASLTQIRAMLTYCVRGERFTDGFFSNMVKKGKITSILQRLKKHQEKHKSLF